MPTFDNLSDALRFLREQLARMDSDRIKVEEENVALKAVIRMLRVTISADERARLADKVVELANSIYAETDLLDDDSRVVIASYVETFHSLLLPSETEPEKPRLSLVQGGLKGPR